MVDDYTVKNHVGVKFENYTHTHFIDTMNLFLIKAFIELYYYSLGVNNHLYMF